MFLSCYGLILFLYVEKLKVCISNRKKGGNDIINILLMRTGVGENVIFVLDIFFYGFFNWCIF